MIVNLARMVYDGLVFASEWCVFLVLIVALINAVLVIVARKTEALVMLAVIFVIKLVFKLYDCAENNCYGEEQGYIFYGGRIIWDSIMFSLETSLFVVLIFAIYSLSVLIYLNLRHALTMWIIFFTSYVVLKSVYGHTSYHMDDWN